jgi:hypothetical protein
MDNCFDHMVLAMCKWGDERGARKHQASSDPDPELQEDGFDPAEDLNLGPDPANPKTIDGGTEPAPGPAASSRFPTLAASLGVTWLRAAP